MSDRYDVIVVGGGLVGATFANLMAARSLRVALVDPKPLPVADAAAPTGARVVALSRASQSLLGSIDAWDGLDASRQCAYSGMRVWDASGSARGPDALAFDSADVGTDRLGTIVENDALLAQVCRAAQSRHELTWMAHSTVTAIDPGRERVRVRLETGGTLSAPLVVIADGARSSSREMLEIDTRAGDYGQDAVVAHVETAQPHEYTAWQRFLPTGPLALLPLADGRSSLVWSTARDEAAELAALDDAAFCARLTEASDRVLGDVAACSPRLTFPLRWLHAQSYCGPRFALLGDAAHAVHPLAGQGVNLGLLDAATLVQVIEQAQEQRRDIGDLDVLRRYERWRRSENGTMLRAFTAINSLFGMPGEAAAGARRFGLAMVNRNRAAKRELILRAMGLRGDLPSRLLTGTGQRR